MKHLLFPAVAALLLAGCSANDADDKAKAINDKKIDQQAVAAGSDAKDDAKQIANYFVEMASMSLTEVELSKLAAQRAVNPQVKAYAREVVTEYTGNERELRALAQQLNVTLPTGLSKEGKDRVDDLTDEKPGTAFDVAYLSEMHKVTGKVVDVADDLHDDAPTDAVREFTAEVKKNDGAFRDRAKSLKNALD